MISGCFQAEKMLLLLLRWRAQTIKTLKCGINIRTKTFVKHSRYFIFENSTQEFVSEQININEFLNCYCKIVVAPESHYLVNKMTLIIIKIYIFVKEV